MAGPVRARRRLTSAERNHRVGLNAYSRTPGVSALEARTTRGQERHSCTETTSSQPELDFLILIVKSTIPPAPNLDACQILSSFSRLLARRQSARIHQVIGVSLLFFVRPVQWRSGQRHETSPRRLENTEWSNELHERIDSGWLRRSVNWSVWLQCQARRHVQLDDAIVGADIQHLATELVSQMRD